MPGLLPDIDPDGLLEFSVVYTDRALNHMSKRFTGVVQDILGTLKEVYHAHTAVLVPGSGTFGMEAVARRRPGHHAPLKKSPPPSALKSPRWCLRPMWKRPAASSFRTTTSAR